MKKDKKNQSILSLLRQVEERRLIWTLLVPLAVLAGIAAILMYEGVSSPIQEKFVADVLTEEEKTAAGEQLVSLYEKEGVPSAPAADVDPLNYGLEDTETAKPSGYFLFSGKKIRTSDPVHMFALDLASEEKEPSELSLGHAKAMLGEFGRAEEGYEFFFLAPNNEQDGMGISKLNTQTNEVISFASTAGLNERNFAWSQDADLLAFNRQNVSAQNYVELLPISNWEVAILDPVTDTITQVIDAAWHPQWSPDGTKLLYLKKDGLYLYDLKTKSENKVVSVNESEEVITTSMLDLSSDGSTLLWTTAKAGVIAVSNITSWEPFAIAEAGRLHEEETEYYWPQFSPDGKFYAVQAIDTLKEGDYVRLNGRVEIRPVSGREIAYTFPLDNFAFNILFTDDWVAQLPE